MYLVLLVGCKAEKINDRGREQETAEQNHPQCSRQCQDQVSPQKEDSCRSRLIVKVELGQPQVALEPKKGGARLTALYQLRDYRLSGARLPDEVIGSVNGCADCTCAFMNQ